MDKRKTAHAKTTKPHAHFDAPDEVVADPGLSKGQKQQALDALEQDARQLSAASAEGMSGGEPTGLHEVLQAKEALDHSPTVHAYDLVLKDLRNRLSTEPPGATRAAVAKALATLEAVPVPTAAKAGAMTFGDPKPGSTAEIETELAMEKLDP